MSQGDRHEAEIVSVPSQLVVKSASLNQCSAAHHDRVGGDPNITILQTVSQRLRRKELGCRAEIECDAVTSLCKRDDVIRTVPKYRQTRERHLRRGILE